MSISLASISKTTRNALPPRVVIHGAQKIGKSTFAANAFKPIFLPLEDGLSGLEVDAFNGGSPLRTYDEVDQALTGLYAAERYDAAKHGPLNPDGSFTDAQIERGLIKDYGTVVVDSTDWLEPLIWAHVCKKNGWASIEAPGYGRGYIEANAVWRDFLDKLNTLRMERHMAVILIAHSAVKRFEAPDSESYDRMELKMQKGALGLIVEWADAILYAQEETAIKKETNGFNSRTRGISTGRRIVNCNAKASFIAGNRYNLPDVLPLDWNAFVDAMAPAPVAQAA